MELDNELGKIRRQLERLASSQSEMASAMARYHNEVAESLAGIHQRPHQFDVEVRELNHRLVDEPSHSASPEAMDEYKASPDVNEVEHANREEPNWTKGDVEKPDASVPMVVTETPGGSTCMQLAQRPAATLAHLGLVESDAAIIHDATTRRNHRVRELILGAEHDMHEELHRSRTLRASGKLQAAKKAIMQAYRDPDTYERVLDTIFGGIIVFNSIFMAFEIDLSRDKGAGPEMRYFWIGMGVLFSIAFIVELILKLRIHGFRGQYCGDSCFLNIFDAFLIGADAAQLIITIGFPRFEEQMEGVPSMSLFRLFRVVRIVRLVRLLKSPLFKDLLTMIQSLFAGVVTLGWAIVLVFLVLYGTAMLCRELLGESDNKDVNIYFNSVPRSIFTMFRCSWGDCSTSGGTPLIEHLWGSDTGAWWGLLYSIFLFFVTIGLFNVITAIFLDSTLSAAAEMALKKQQARMSDKKLWRKSAYKLIVKMLQQFGGVGQYTMLSDVVEDIIALEVPRHALHTLVREDPEVAQILNTLDIDPHDHARLGDILDADHSGSLGMAEFLSGLQRLRGTNPSRSDVVSLDLMIRSIQDDIHTFKQEMRLLIGAQAREFEM